MQYFYKQNYCKNEENNKREPASKLIVSWVDLGLILDAISNYFGSHSASQINENSGMGVERPLGASAGGFGRPLGAFGGYQGGLW